MARRDEGVTLIPYEHIDHDHFVRVANALGWIRQVVREGDGEKISFQEIWTTKDQENAISYINDPLVLTRFLWVRGKDLDDLLFEIVRRIPLYEEEELLEEVVEASDHDQLVESLFRVAVGFPRFNASAFQVFETTLGHSNALIRKATVQALGYNFWQESIPLLQQAAQTDPDEEVRQFANAILTASSDS